MNFSPEYLRGEAVATIIDALHQHAQHGPWHLESVTTETDYAVPMTFLTFTVGFMDPSGEDKRPRITISVKEDK